VEFRAALKTFMVDPTEDNLRALKKITDELFVCLWGPCGECPVTPICHIFYGARHYNVAEAHLVVLEFLSSEEDKP
jgi:hypothetical protein